MSELIAKNLKGKTVLVTGAGSGIGYSIMKNLIQVQGANVIAWSLDHNNLKVIEKEFNCKIITQDMTDVEGVKKVTTQLVEENQIDYLVNNAGITILEPFLDTKYENFRKVFQVNLEAILVISQIIAKQMIQRKVKGSIVNISSQASKVGLINHASYCSSKSALDGLTQVMALELGAFGIRVNCINPTVVLTKMGRLAWSDPKKSERMLDRIPLGKFSEVESVVDTVIFLLVTDMINGHHLPVDGGFLAAPFNNSKL